MQPDTYLRIPRRVVVRVQEGVRVRLRARTRKIIKFFNYYEFANFWQTERTGATAGRGRTWARTGTSISITWKPVIQPAETFSLLSGIHPERAA